MTTSLLEWTRAEIARLRDLEKTARAQADAAKQEADTLQRTLDGWQGGSPAQPATPPAPKPQTIVRRPVRTKRTNGHAKNGAAVPVGAKNALALKELRAAGAAGLTKDDLFASFRAVFGPGYSRANLRSMLVHLREKDWNGLRVTAKDDRYFVSEVAH